MPYSIVHQDLTRIETDAVVISANEHLVIDGGVGLALAEEAGASELRAACEKIGFCATGSAVATPAFNLGAKVIIHAVGPVWQGGTAHEAETLARTYKSAFECALENSCESVAVPLISSGAFGYPAKLALDVAVEAIRSFLETHDIEIILAVYDYEAVRAAAAFYDDVICYLDDELSPVQRSARFDPYTGEPLYGAASLQEMRMGSVCMDAAMPARASFAAEEMQFDASVPEPDSLESWLEQIDEPLSVVLLKLIDERGLTDAQIYNRANISRQVFNKIKNQPNYHPGKSTVLSLCVALELDLPETEEVLSRAGFALNPSEKFDLVVKFFILRGVYDHFEINKTLFALDLPLLGTH